MTIDYRQILPAELAEVAEAAGLEVALRLRRQLGGTAVHVARNPRGGLLVEAVGREAAQAIAGRFGGETIKVPMGKQLQRPLIRHLLEQGRDVQEIARTIGCHAETVRREKNGRDSGRQICLFE
ncbi:MAG: helix-turn-helix domain-containing protein [Tistlia sp.]|uniref:helix-turn-helix domain-containing protein n=1 Tax=Tistlia sp. TaxID=3057121 RepID=UPI0034A13741